MHELNKEDPELLKKLLQSIEHACALVDPDAGHIIFENAQFFKLFPLKDDSSLEAESVDTLTGRIPTLDFDLAKERIHRRGKFRKELESLEQKKRPIPVKLVMTPFEFSSASFLLAEAHDISNEQETRLMLESYSKIAERNASNLKKEKDRVERLLLNVMPRAVYDEIKTHGTTTPQKFDHCSILMLDFVKFTEMAVSNDASSVIAELNDIFSAFDRITEVFGCERLRTVGDSYMAISGIHDDAPDHCQNIAKVALRMRRYLEKRNAAHPEPWRCRIGINTGPVIGSLVGVQKYVYDLFGPGVNLAARMEQLSSPMCITLNERTLSLIRDDFVYTERGEIEVKGFGTMKLYYLESERN